jgi:hypothetical protein
LPFGRRFVISRRWSEPASEQEDSLMTSTRSWLAFVVLLTALTGGTLRADEPAKKVEKLPAPACSVKAGGCCAEKCSTSQGCCEGKCCTQDKAKGCCADGKCCGCCSKAAPQMATLPVAPGSAIQVMIAPPGAFDAAFTQDLGCPIGPIQPPVPAYAPAPPCMQFACPAMPTPTALAPPPPPAPCQAACSARAGVTPWRLRAVVEKERTCLEMQLTGAGEDASVCCDHMVLKIGGESLKVSICDKQIQVSGSFVKGSADSLTRNTTDGSITLEGHVKVHYDKDGQKAAVSGERVVVGIADGRLEVKPVEKPQTFTFWIGNFR